MSSKVAKLASAYRQHLTVPWHAGLAAIQRVIFAVYNKDRGKDVESAPWFKVFKGDRINDHHLTLAEKMAAKGAKP